MKRTADGRFGKTCDSKLHDKNRPHTYLISVSKGKKLSKKDFEILMSSNLLLADAKNVCKPCIDKILEANFLKGLRQDEKEITKPDEYYENESEMARDYSSYLSLKATQLAKELKPLIKVDVNSLKNTSIKSIEEVLMYQPQNWSSERPKPLIDLLYTLCGVDVKSASEENQILIAKIVELIYSCINKKMVLPNHFFENLLCYSLTNCKSHLNFLSRRSPGGGYTYICNWLGDQSKDPIKFPRGLVKCVFDNSQKVGKTYLISATNKVPTSVITSQMWITFDEDDEKQTNKELSPKVWIGLKLSEMQKQSLIDYITRPSDQFRVTRNKQLKWCIDFVRKEINGNEIIERIIQDEIISEQQKVCTKCGCENDVSFRVCRNPDCGGNIVREELDFSNYTSDDYLKIDPYEAFKAIPAKVPNIKCTTGEPDFLNPNGYFNIVQVLQGIGERSGIKQYGTGKREWLFVECDGLPSNLIRDIITNVLRCAMCKRCFWGREAFNDHNCYIVNSSEAAKEFDWLVPVYGLLHLEMNLARAFVKLNWEVFVKSSGNTLGFKTPKASSYLYKGADHHKLWHLLEILYIGITLELVYPYVKSCIDAGTSATSDGYWEWSNEAENPNYVYMQHAALNDLHALMMLRAGVRKCNPLLIKDSVAKIHPIVFARNHPIYQKILYFGARDQILMPDVLKNILDNYVSGSKSMKLGKCQGGDALLEELNKDSKSWLKMAGIPGEDQWLRVFRNLDNLNKVGACSSLEAWNRLHLLTTRYTMV